MSKIILKEVSKGICRWFCEACDQRIDYVPENLFSMPLIDSCPHCGITFSGYELCQTRKDNDKKIWEGLMKMRGDTE